MGYLASVGMADWTAPTPYPSGRAVRVVSGPARPDGVIHRNIFNKIVVFVVCRIAKTTTKMALSILENLSCKLPVASVPADVDTENIFTGFQNTLSSLNAENLTSEALWRDMFAYTGSIHTYYGADNVIDTWRALTTKAAPKDVRFSKTSSRIVRLGESNWIEGTFNFEIRESPARTCMATVSLVQTKDQKWKIWVLRTFIDGLEGHPNVDKLAPVPHTNGYSVSTRTKSESQNAFECVVVGAGQAGLSVAGRLKSQGIKYVLLEKNKAVGDSWKNRYNSTKREFLLTVSGKDCD